MCPPEPLAERGSPASCGRQSHKPVTVQQSRWWGEQCKRSVKCLHDKTRLTSIKLECATCTASSSVFTLYFAVTQTDFWMKS